MSKRSPGERSDTRDRFLGWISRRRNRAACEPTAARARPTQRLTCLPNCEIAYRQSARFGVYARVGAAGGDSSVAGCSSSFSEYRHARFQSHGHSDVAALHSSVHLERVNQGYFACADNRVQGFFLGPRRRRTGLFHFLFLPSAARRCPCDKGRGVMWYFGPDLAFDLVKGLVAGAASMALQVVAPMTVRAVKRLRARWSARRAARKASRGAKE